MTFLAPLETIPRIAKHLSKSKPEEILDWAQKAFGGKLIFATSMGAEDQILTHLLASIFPDVRIFTLDTGRLFQETYSLIQQTEDRYKLKIEVFCPDSKKVEPMVNTHGINLFYKSTEMRKFCCGVRKIEPLKRALAGTDAWICGLRKNQSTTRQKLSSVEWDIENGLTKINPLWNWLDQQVWDYIKTHEIPYNPLHDKGFLSIGCSCCTRPVSPGESLRDGRWWWEEHEKKECGLHH